MRFPSEVSLSPDGKRVAYVVRQWIHDQPKLLARIWIADADGNDPAPLTKGAKSDTHPCWSPDGQQVAYVSVSEGEKSKPQLFVIPATGGESRQVCTMPNGINEPAWSPDGSRISFLSLEGEEPKTDPIVVSPDR